ncbi:14585_t:CDS:1, partial [Racocetra fulgida]
MIYEERAEEKVDKVGLSAKPRPLAILSLEAGLAGVQKHTLTKNLFSSKQEKRALAQRQTGPNPWQAK